ncbi:heparinase [Cupriavidus sp. USMAHM13]|uniref:heparinase II/III family protein n=1 Tax=Cupriavidus sp. USMAHM13 TaxID=1389192 RepID=UPI0008A68878|nr:heparinase II/III-family protein [Cupriavidus sp. USMAHM13]AOZ01169.1 heparinase [Cupriavidus sp. USMAHM13]
MTKLLLKARAVLALGLPSVVRAASYRLGVKLALNPVRRLEGAAPKGPFFQAKRGDSPPVSTTTQWVSFALLFGRWNYRISDLPPDWLGNPLTGKRVPDPTRNWWQIPDFDPAVGDIKLIWELSRFDWVIAFAQQVRNGDPTARARLNHWLSDWCANNPPYRGPNWKCGQEASIRVMHLAMAAVILGEVQMPLAGLKELLLRHLHRIAPTIKYAVAQDNNHGTSEAAALFIGGSWLEHVGVGRAAAWRKTGEKWLEDRASKLIGVNGSFSQYSLNYHRVMLDTFSIAEVWRLHLRLPAFSQRLRDRLQLATNWLYQMIDRDSGDGPNVGANDGARLLQLSDSDYRDFRPSVQLAMAIHMNRLAYGKDGHWNDALHWLGIPLPSDLHPDQASCIADDGGFAILRNKNAMALLRYPRFRYRPSQADALHVDFWVAGENRLRDGGTFSYNTEESWLNYFSGTVSHNTVQFDGKNQMPKVSRFLFGDWLKAERVEWLVEEEGRTSFAAAYRDRSGLSHSRKIQLEARRLSIVDEISGFKKTAVLRWRLSPGDWRLDASRIYNDGHELRVRASMPIVRMEVVEGWESRYYLEKTSLPVLEIEVREPGTLITEYKWE